MTIQKEGTRSQSVARGGYDPQYDLLPFTDFDTVDHTTPLESLNLNWREQDLPESVRTKHVHRLHPYLGKFVPQLVEVFLRKFRPKVVCDPFGGSGTTLVEAAALGDRRCRMRHFRVQLPNFTSQDISVRACPVGI